MKLSEEEIRYLANGLNKNENDIAELVREYNKKGGKKGLWPAKNGWWQSTKWIQKVTKRYQYLVPVLDALKRHRAIDQYKTSDILDTDERHSLNDEKYLYVLLDLSKSRKLIADQIRCSEKTLALYIRGLVECGLLKYFPHGRKKYYSLGYWMQYPLDPKNKNTEWVL